MSKLSDELAKAIHEAGINLNELSARTNNLVPARTIQAMRSGTYIPKQLDALTALAVALEKNPNYFKIYALLDAVDKELEFYGQSYEVLCKHVKTDVKAQFKLNLYSLEELPTHLSAEGYPAKQSGSTVNIPHNCGKYAYALKITDNTNAPKLDNGDIAVVKPNYKNTQPYYYAVTKLKDGNIMVGRIIDSTVGLTIETTYPYTITQTTKKSLAFIHPIVLTFKADLLE